jgi:hypothetical protein
MKVSTTTTSTTAATAGAAGDWPVARSSTWLGLTRCRIAGRARVRYY